MRVSSCSEQEGLFLSGTTGSLLRLVKIFDEPLVLRVPLGRTGGALWRLVCNIVAMLATHSQVIIFLNRQEGFSEKFICYVLRVVTYERN
jgi:hypothetical protein